MSIGMELDLRLVRYTIAEWSVVWRAGRHDAHLKAATYAISRCVEELGWLISPKSSWWIPESDRKQLRSIRNEVPEPAR